MNRWWTHWWIAPALLVTFGLGCRPPKNPYPEEVVSAFVGRCTAQAPRGACECTLDEIQRRFTYEQFTRLEQQTRDTGKPPAEFQDVARDCR